jgi:hypothetical protein
VTGPAADFFTEPCPKLASRIAPHRPHQVLERALIYICIWCYKTTPTKKEATVPESATRTARMQFVRNDFDPAEEGKVIATAEVDLELGNVYVDAETLSALIDAWTEVASSPRTESHGDRLWILAHMDGDGPAAHVVESGDSDGRAHYWSVPVDGWWPLGWSIEPEEATTWEVQVNDDDDTADLLDPVLADNGDHSTLRVWAKTDERGVPVLYIDATPFLGSGFHVETNTGRKLMLAPNDARTWFIPAQAAR